MRIGTRGSALALAQSGMVQKLLPGGAAILTVIETTGDRNPLASLRRIGGKGIFTKEIDTALLEGRIDLAVHSLKDMETVLPPGLAIGCVLPRDDPRDALVARGGAGLADLPPGARIGTASLRRRAQLLRRRPDLAIVPMRGNVNTRLGKLDMGEVDALVLALCGLERLGKADLASDILSAEAMLPAVGQGALAVECRGADDEVRALLTMLHDPDTAACVTSERAMLAALDGSCRTPIAGLATMDGDRLTLEALLLSQDGSAERRGQGSGPVADAQGIGTELGEQLRRGAGPEFGFG